MQAVKVEYRKDFEVLLGNKYSQSAVMVLEPGKNEGGSDNRHESSDQWLYVISGKGIANVNGKDFELSAGILLLIERGEIHEIKNTGDENLSTLNFYVPPE